MPQEAQEESWRWVSVLLTISKCVRKSHMSGVMTFCFQGVQCQKEEVNDRGRSGCRRGFKHEHSPRLACNKQLPSSARTASQPCDSTALPSASAFDFAAALRCSVSTWCRELQHGDRGGSEETSGDWRQVTIWLLQQIQTFLALS